MWSCETAVKALFIKDLNNLCNLGNSSNYAYLGDFCCLERVFFQLSGLKDGDWATEADSMSSSRQPSTIQIQLLLLNGIQPPSEAAECWLRRRSSARGCAASAGVSSLSRVVFFTAGSVSLKYTFHNNILQRFVHNGHNAESLTWLLAYICSTSPCFATWTHNSMREGY